MCERSLEVTGRPDTLPGRPALRGTGPLETGPLETGPLETGPRYRVQVDSTSAFSRQA